MVADHQSCWDLVVTFVKPCHNLSAIVNFFVTARLQALWDRGITEHIHKAPKLGIVTSCLSVTEFINYLHCIDPRAINIDLRSTVLV